MENQTITSNPDNNLKLMVGIVGGTKKQNSVDDLIKKTMEENINENADDSAPLQYFTE